MCQHHNVAEFSIIPYTDCNVRAAYHYIATGETLDGSWYRDLDTPTSTPNVVDFIQEHMDQPCSSSVTFPEDGPSSSASASETNNSDDVDNSESDEIEEDEIQPFIDSYKENYKKFESKLFNNLQKSVKSVCFIQGRGCWPYINGLYS